MAESAKLVEQGVSIGIDASAQSKLAINLRAARVEGLSLPAQLLKISTVIR
jgi:hypothetical protein